MSIWTNMTFDGPDVHIEYDYTCKECGKTFHSAMDVPDFAADIIPRPTLCDQCGERLKQEAEKREKEARYRKRSIEAGVPLEFLNYDKSRGNSALFSAMKQHWDKSMFIIGSYDTGKSRALAYCLTRWIIADKGLSTQFYNWTRLCELYVAKAAEGMVKANDFKSDLLATDILAIDDFGKRRPTPVMEDLTYELINGVYESGKRLWMTSNKPLREVLQVYENRDIAEAVISRFDRMIRDGTMVKITATAINGQKSP